MILILTMLKSYSRIDVLGPVLIKSISGLKLMLIRYLLLVFLIFSSVAQSAFASKNIDSIIDKLNEIDANVLLMRHAVAPGFGDPDNFVIKQCVTQRNLDVVGRHQAVSLGQRLKQSGIEIDKVYSSYWCRCLETAKLLKLGVVERFAGLNSFFEGHVDRDQTLHLLQKKLANLDQSSLTLMVTHQVVIQAVTGMSVSSGSFVAYNSLTGEAARIIIE